MLLQPLTHGALAALLLVGPQGEIQGPGPVAADVFHPDRDEPVEPAWGGRVVVHLRSLPRSVCYPLDNSSYARWILREVHEGLVQRDWETWEYEPVLASGWDVEDTLVLGEEAARREGLEAPVFGRVSDAGEAWRIEPVSADNPLGGVREIPKADVERVERETVYTFHLREGIRWHDGHPLDLHDVLFSYGIFANPGVDCDSVRAKYTEQIVGAEAAGPRSVRFFYAHQYFNVLGTFEDFCILPSHLYDLADPDNPDHDPENAASPEEQARYINENPHNTRWVGLGPYRLTTWSQEYVEAERFPGYFDPAEGGYLDRIRWRHIPNDDTAFQALVNGELDFMNRISSADYFGEATAASAFTDHLYKGYYYTASYNYTPWNTLRPQLSDVRVRIALAHCFDFDEYIRTTCHGLAKQVTGPQFYFGPSYDHAVEPFPYDLDRAEELLAEAGWYDRDGDQIIDKDGIPFEIGYLTVPGNTTVDNFSQKLQENLGRVGIKMNVEKVEFASFMERVLDREFDATGMAWSLPLENDPEQLWHSRGARPGMRGSNRSAVADPKIDALIERGQRELDPDERHAIWRELHRYLYYEVQPYLFRATLPRKFGMSKAIRGVQVFPLDPGYSIRRWYYPAGTPGTRSTPAR